MNTEIKNKDLTSNDAKPVLAEVKLYKAQNGDASIVLMLFAENKKQAKKIAKKYIREEYDEEEDFPVLDIIEIKHKKGVFETFNFNDF